MFFDLELALAALPELGERTRAALGRLLPGAVTLVLPNPARRYPLACGPVPERLGLRVPALHGPLAPLAAAKWPVLQSSANPSGGADARRLEDVDARIRAGVDLQLDGGELPGTPSTVVDLGATRRRAFSGSFARARSLRPRSKPRCDPQRTLQLNNFRFVFAANPVQAPRFRKRRRATANHAAT